MIKNTMVKSLSIIGFSFVLVACGSNSKIDGDDGGVGGGTTGLSIAYQSTDYTDAQGFIDHYRVHATNANGDPVSGLPLRTSIVSGVKEIRNQKLQRNTGNIEISSPINFFDNGINYTQTGVIVGDNLIILPSSGKTDNSYLGDWSISAVGASLSFLEGSFNLESTNDLTYIIGNETRFLGDSSRGITAVAHIESSQNTTDADGFSSFDLVYDPALAGHTLTIGVHTDGNRLGSGIVTNYRGGTFSAASIVVPITGGIVNTFMHLIITYGGGATESLIDLDTAPSSYTAKPEDSCSIITQSSNYHTDGRGFVTLAVATSTENNATQCAISWAGGTGSLFLEY